MSLPFCVKKMGLAPSYDQDDICSSSVGAVETRLPGRVAMVYNNEASISQVHASDIHQIPNPIKRFINLIYVSKQN